MPSFAFVLRPRIIRARMALLRMLGRAGSGGLAAIAAIAALSGTCVSVHAAPPEIAIAKVTAGTAKVSTVGDVTSIRTSDRAIIQFSKLGIPEGSTLRFDQPSASSRVLGRITSKAPTQIDGSLLANGRVFLVNRAGIMFGRNAVVNVGSLYAAAGDISNRDFLNGDLRFRTAPGGVVTNLGSITTTGTAALIGREVINVGNVSSGAGTVVFAAGPDIFVSEQGSNVLVKVRPQVGDGPGGTRPGVTNRGTVRGRGVVFSASDALGTAILNQGLVSAPGGSVEMRADAGVAIEAPVSVASSAGSGGSIHIDAGRAGEASVRASLDASSSDRAGAGGTVEVTGASVRLADSASIDASGPAGGGTVHLGGREFGGPGLPTANLTFVDPRASIRADATDFGGGGRIVVFGEALAQVEGELTARGGTLGGDGGFIETSSRGALRLPTAPNVAARAAGEDPGTWLIDPLSIRIVAGNGATESTGNGSNGNPFTPSGGPTIEPLTAQLGVEVIKAALANGNVVVTTFPGVGTAGAGDIILDAPLDFVGPAALDSARTLTFRAFNDVTLLNRVTATNLNSQVFTLDLQAGLGAGATGAVRQLAAASPGGTASGLRPGGPSPGGSDGGGLIENPDVVGGGSGANPLIDLGPNGALLVSGRSLESSAGIIATSALVNVTSGPVSMAGINTIANLTVSASGPVAVSTEALGAVSSLTSTGSSVSVPTAGITGAVTRTSLNIDASGRASIGDVTAPAAGPALFTLTQTLTIIGGSVDAADVAVVGTARVTALAGDARVVLPVNTDLNLGASEAQGTMSLTATGTGRLRAAAGNPLIRGGSFDLSSTSADASAVNFGNIEVTGPTGGITVSAPNGGVTLASAQTSGLRLGPTTAGTALAVSTAGDLSNTGAILVPGGAAGTTTATFSSLQGDISLGGLNVARRVAASAAGPGGDITLDAGANTLTTGAITAGTGATNVTLRADRMSLDGGDGSIQNIGGGGTLRIRPNDAARNVALGGAAADDAGTLGLSGAEMLTFRDGFASIEIGSVDGGAPVSGAYTFVGNATLRDPLVVATAGSFGASSAANQLSAAGPAVTLTIRADNATLPAGGTLVTNLAGVTVGPFSATRGTRLGSGGDATTLNLDQNLISLLSPSAGTLTITGASITLPDQAGSLAFTRPTTLDAGSGAISINQVINTTATGVDALTLRAGSLALDAALNAAAGGVRLVSAADLSLDAAGTGPGMGVSQGEIALLNTPTLTLDAAGTVRAGGVNFGPRGVVVTEENTSDGIDIFELTGNLSLGNAALIVNRDAVLTSNATITVARDAGAAADAVRFGRTLISGPGGPFDLTINPGTRGVTTFVGDVGGTGAGSLASRLGVLRVSTASPGVGAVNVNAGLRADDIRLAANTLNLQNAVIRSVQPDGGAELRADAAINVNASTVIDAERVVFTTLDPARAIGVGDFDVAAAGLSIPDSLIARVDAENLDMLTVGDDTRTGGITFGNVNTGGRNLRLLRGGADPVVNAAPQAGQTAVRVDTDGGSFTVGRFENQLAGEAARPNNLGLANNTSLTIDTIGTAADGAVRVTGTTGAGSTGAGLTVRASDGAGVAQDGEAGFDGRVTVNALDVRGGGVTLAEGFAAGAGGATLNATDNAKRTLVRGAADSTSASFIRFNGNAASERSLTALGGTIVVARGDSVASGGDGVGTFNFGRELAQGETGPLNLTLDSRDGAAQSGVSVAGTTTLVNAAATLLTQGDAVTLTGAVNGTAGANGAPESLAIDARAAGTPAGAAPGDVTLTGGVFGAGGTASEEGLQSLRIVNANDMTTGAVAITRDFRTASADGAENREATGNITANGRIAAGRIDLRTAVNAGSQLDRAITLNQGFVTNTDNAQAGTANFQALTTTLDGQASTAAQGVDFTGNAVVNASLTATADDVRSLNHATTPLTGNLTANAPVTASTGDVTTDANLNANADVRALRNVNVGNDLTIGAANVSVASTGTGNSGGDVTVRGITSVNGAGATISTVGTNADITLGDDRALDRVQVASNADATVSTQDGNITINGRVVGTAAGVYEALSLIAADAAGGAANGVVDINGPVGANLDGTAADALSSLSVTGREVTFRDDVGSQDGASRGVDGLWQVRAGETLAFRGDRHTAGAMDINFTSEGRTATIADGVTTFFTTSGVVPGGASALSMSLLGGRTDDAGLFGGVITGEALSAAGETLTLDAGDAGAIRVGAIRGVDASGITDVTIRNARNAAVPAAGADALTIFGSAALSSVDIIGAFTATDDIRGDVTVGGRVRAGRILITADTDAAPAINLAQIRLNQGFEAMSAANTYAAVFEAATTTISGQASTSARGLNIIGDGVVASTAPVTVTTGNFDTDRDAGGAGGNLTENAGVTASAGNVTTDADLNANGGVTAGADVIVGNDLNANADVAAGDDVDITSNASIGVAGVRVRSLGTGTDAGTISVDGSTFFNASGELTTAGANGTITLGDSAADMLQVGNGVSAVVSTSNGEVSITGGRIVGGGANESLAITAGTTARRAVTITANVGTNSAGTAIEDALATLAVTGSNINYTGVIGTEDAAGVVGTATFTAIDGVNLNDPAGFTPATTFFNAGVWSIDADADNANPALSNFTADGRLIGSVGDVTIRAAQTITLNQGFRGASSGVFTAGVTDFNSRGSTADASIQVNGTANVNASVTAGTGVGISRDANLSDSVTALSNGVTVGDTTRFLQSTSISATGSNAAIVLGDDEASDRLLIAGGRTATITASNGPITITGDALGFVPAGGGTASGETLTVNAGTGAVRFNGNIGITQSPVLVLDAIETATITGGSVTVTRNIGRAGVGGAGVNTLTINAADGFALNETFAQNPDAITHVATVVANANTDGDADGTGTVNGRLVADRSLNLRGVNLLLARGFEARNDGGLLGDDDYAAILTAVDSTIRGQASTSMKGLLIDGNALIEADITTFNFGRTALFNTAAPATDVGLGVTGNTTLRDDDASTPGLTLASSGRHMRFGTSPASVFTVRSNTDARVLTGSGTTAAPGVLAGDLFITGEVRGGTEAGAEGRTLLLSAAVNTDTTADATSAELAGAGQLGVTGRIGTLSDTAGAPLDRLTLIGRGVSLARGVGHDQVTGVEGDLRIAAQTALLGSSGESRWMSTRGLQDYNADVRLRGGKMSFRSQVGPVGGQINDALFAMRVRRTFASDAAPEPRTAVDLFSNGRVDFFGDMTRLGAFRSQPGAPDNVSYFTDNGVRIGPGVALLDASSVQFWDHVSMASVGGLTFRTQPGSQGVLEFHTSVGGPRGPREVFPSLAQVPAGVTDLIIDAGGLVRFLSVVEGLKSLELGGINFQVGPEISVTDQILIKTATVLEKNLKLGGRRITFQQTVNGSGLDLEIGAGTETTTFEGEVSNVNNFLASDTGTTVLGANFTANNANIRNTLTFRAAGPYVFTANQLATFNGIDGNNADVTIRGQILDFTSGGLNFGELLITGLSPTAAMTARGAFSSGTGGAVVEVPVTLTGDTTWAGSGGLVEFRQAVFGGAEGTAFSFTFTGNNADLRIVRDATGFNAFNFTAQTTDSDLIVAADLLTASSFNILGDVMVQNPALGLGYNLPEEGDNSLLSDDPFTESITITGNVLAFGSDPVRLRARARNITITGAVGSETNPVQSWEVFAIDGVADQSTLITDTVYLAAGDGAANAAIAIFRTPAELRNGLRIVRVGGSGSGTNRYALLRFEKDVTLGGRVEYFDETAPNANDLYALSRFEFRGVLRLLESGATIDLRNAGPGSQGVFFFGGVQNAGAFNAPFTVLVNTTTPREAQRWVKRRPTRALGQKNVDFVTFDEQGNPVTGPFPERQWARVDYRDRLPVIAFGGDLGSPESPLGRISLNFSGADAPITGSRAAWRALTQDVNFRSLVPKVATIWMAGLSETESPFAGTDVEGMLRGSTALADNLTLFRPLLGTGTVFADPAQGRLKTFTGRGIFSSSDFVMGFNEKLTALGSLSISANARAFLSDVTALNNLTVRAGAFDAATNRFTPGDIFLLRRTEGALRTAFATFGNRTGRNTFKPRPIPGDAEKSAEDFTSKFYYNAVPSTRTTADSAILGTLATPLLDKGLDFVAGGQEIRFFGRIDATPDVQLREAPDGGSAARPLVVTPRARFASAGRGNGAIAGAPVLVLRDNLDFPNPRSVKPGKPKDSTLAEDFENRDHNALSLFRIYFADPADAVAPPPPPPGGGTGPAQPVVLSPESIDLPDFDIVLDLTADGIANGANITNLVGAINDEPEADITFTQTALTAEELEQFRDLRLRFRDAPEPTRFDGLVGRTLFNDNRTRHREDSIPPTIAGFEQTELAEVGLAVVTVDRVSLSGAKAFLQRLNAINTSDRQWDKVFSELREREEAVGASQLASQLLEPGEDPLLADGASIFAAMRELHGLLRAAGFTPSEVTRAWSMAVDSRLKGKIDRADRFPIRTYNEWLKRQGDLASVIPVREPDPVMDGDEPEQPDPQAAADKPPAVPVVSAVRTLKH